ncbi:hypothetical protein OBBRIDRAFT_890480 [Obba rivulosa]|uniref:Uncharacterized protein n=1 Tax=Obba rivulosa TaxID=1052685 RepID=A0A8E2DFW8_9APHY|nr:hypothetical protein OBBRIDRAFT_890480 [Obba rivulosa]
MIPLPLVLSSFVALCMIYFGLNSTSLAEPMAYGLSIVFSIFPAIANSISTDYHRARRSAKRILWNLTSSVSVGRHTEDWSITGLQIPFGESLRPTPSSLVKGPRHLSSPYGSEASDVRRAKTTTISSQYCLMTWAPDALEMVAGNRDKMCPASFSIEPCAHEGGIFSLIFPTCAATMEPSDTPTSTIQVSTAVLATSPSSVACATTTISFASKTSVLWRLANPHAITTIVESFNMCWSAISFCTLLLMLVGALLVCRPSLQDHPCDVKHTVDNVPDNVPAATCPFPTEDISEEPHGLRVMPEQQASDMSERVKLGVESERPGRDIESRALVVTCTPPNPILAERSPVLTPQHRAPSDVNPKGTAPPIIQSNPVTSAAPSSRLLQPRITVRTRTHYQQFAYLRPKRSPSIHTDTVIAHVQKSDAYPDADVAEKRVDECLSTRTAPDSRFSAKINDNHTTQTDISAHALMNQPDNTRVHPQTEAPSSNQLGDLADTVAMLPSSSELVIVAPANLSLDGTQVDPTDTISASALLESVVVDVSSSAATTSAAIADDVAGAFSAPNGSTQQKPFDVTSEHHALSKICANAPIPTPIASDMVTDVVAHSGCTPEEGSFVTSSIEDCASYAMGVDVSIASSLMLSVESNAPPTSPIEDHIPAADLVPSVDGFDNLHEDVPLVPAYVSVEDPSLSVDTAVHSPPVNTLYLLLVSPPHETYVDTSQWNEAESSVTKESSVVLSSLPPQDLTEDTSITIIEEPLVEESPMHEGSSHVDSPRLLPQPSDEIADLLSTPIQPFEDLPVFQDMNVDDAGTSAHDFFQSNSPALVTLETKMAIDPPYPMPSPPYDNQETYDHRTLIFDCSMDELSRGVHIDSPLLGGPNEEPQVTPMSEDDLALNETSESMECDHRDFDEDSQLDELVLGRLSELSLHGAPESSTTSTLSHSDAVSGLQSRSDAMLTELSADDSIMTDICTLGWNAPSKMSIVPDYMDISDGFNNSAMTPSAGWSDNVHMDPVSPIETAYSLPTSFQASLSPTSYAQHSISSPRHHPWELTAHDLSGDVDMHPMPSVDISDASLPSFTPIFSNAEYPAGDFNDAMPVDTYNNTPDDSSSADLFLNSSASIEIPQMSADAFHSTFSNYHGLSDASGKKFSLQTVSRQEGSVLRDIPSVSAQVDSRFSSNAHNASESSLPNSGAVEGPLSDPSFGDASASSNTTMQMPFHIDPEELARRAQAFPSIGLFIDSPLLKAKIGDFLQSLEVNPLPAMLRQDAGSDFQEPENTGTVAPQTDPYPGAPFEDEAVAKAEPSNVPYAIPPAPSPEPAGHSQVGPPPAPLSYEDEDEGSEFEGLLDELDLEEESLAGKDPEGYYRMCGGIGPYPGSLAAQSSVSSGLETSESTFSEPDTEAEEPTAYTDELEYGEPHETQISMPHLQDSPTSEVGFWGDTSEDRAPGDDQAEDDQAKDDQAKDDQTENDQMGDHWSEDDRENGANQSQAGHAGGGRQDNESDEDEPEVDWGDEFDDEEQTDDISATDQLDGDDEDDDDIEAELYAAADAAGEDYSTPIWPEDVEVERSKARSRRRTGPAVVAMRETRKRMHHAYAHGGMQPDDSDRPGTSTNGDTQGTSFAFNFNFEFKPMPSNEPATGFQLSPCQSSSL